MASLINALGSLVLGCRAEERILLIGNDASGKTTLLYKLKLGEVVTTIPTIGFNVETIRYKKVDYTLWDIGGCDRIRALWRHYVCKSTHTIYLHSCTEDEERTKESIELLHVHAETIIEKGAHYLFLVLNKQDLLDPEDRESIVSRLHQRFEKELSQYDRKITWKICDLPNFSASTGEQLYETLDIIHETIGANRKKGVRPSPVEVLTRRSDHERTPEADLIALIKKEGVDEFDAETYWNEFLSGDIPEWNHRSHLRAGYNILLDTLWEGKGIFETAETFLDHLRRLKDTNPDRFRNTEHRTMTVFWLYNLQIAILTYKQANQLDKLPTRCDFQQILLHSPRLMDGSLWKDYFSKDLMFSPEAKEYWRLPDLQALPDFTQTLSLKRHVRRPSQEEPYRVMRFAFTVVQKYMSSDVRRGWLIKQALASLQSTTMRLRVKNPSISPFSETQAYFWIQMIHTALATVSTTNAYTQNPLHVPVDRLSFSSFRVLFDIESNVWKEYYTPKTWESIEARMTFVNPDLKPLPNVLDLPFPGNIDKALSRQLDSARLGMAAELPSMEDLSLRATLILEDAKSVTKPVSAKAKNHAHLLLYLYTNLVAHANSESSTPLASRATTAMMSLSGSNVPTFTKKAFWTQQMLVASGRASNPSTNSEGDSSMPVPSFEDFIKANLHLVYEDLVLCYYSPELLGSLEAREGFVPPDRRKMKGFLVLEGSARYDEGDEWVVV